jgi:tetratricopeptide (TPR) repeat protein
MSAGAVQFRLGRSDSALLYLRQALATLREVGDRAGEGQTLGNIGVVHRDLGRADSALFYYRQALTIAREVGDQSSESSDLHNIAGVHDLLGRPDSGLIYFQRGLAVERRINDRTGQAETLNGVGVMYQALGFSDSALTSYRRALTISREVKDLRVEGISFHNIGHLNEALGQKDSALVYYQAATTIAQQVGERLSEGRSLNNIGQVWFALRRPDSALAYYRRALAIRREIADKDGEARTLNELGVLFHRGITPSDLRTAVAYYDSAAATQAVVGAHTGGDPNRLTFAERQVGLFGAWSLAWLARSSEIGKRSATLAGLAAAERGRAQALLELMRGASRDVGAGRDLELEGRQLLEHVVRARTAALYYLVTTDTLLIWVITPDGHIDFVRQSIARDSLARLVGGLRAGLGGGSAANFDRFALKGGERVEPLVRRGVGIVTEGTASFDSIATALSDLLLPSSVVRQFGSVREIVVVPHGILSLVPFAALFLDSARSPVSARYAVRYAPSLSALAQSESKPSTPVGPGRKAAFRRALVVGNPAMPTKAFGEAFMFQPLPLAHAEAVWVASQLEARSLVGAGANEAEVRRRLPAAPLVHLATHGYAYASEARARYSFIALAEGNGHDGFLTVGEVLEDPSLKLQAELVVLSACQTGLGDLKQAEGTVGLQRAFLARGARGVLVSLWSVSDKATELLMKGFYSHWLKDGDGPSKAEALRRAQEQLRAQPQFRSPSSWAAFQLVGA